MPLQATSGAASYDAFGGGVAAVPTYIEDVFSTWLYTGNGSTQTITNGIDLSGKGGLVWAKYRSQASNHYLIDSGRGVPQTLSSNTTAAQYSDNVVTAFNSNGFTTGSGGNASSQTMATWSFRKQPKFFDVVTYTGNGGTSQTIAHNLGATPGCIMVKRTDTTGNWLVYHTSLGATQGLALNLTMAQDTATGYWADTAPTSTNFTVGNYSDNNASGGTYVAYLFAHNAGGFGLTGTDNVISCGSYTGNGSADGPTISLGYEPQWILIKNATSTGNWTMYDNMRGIPTGGNTSLLVANTTAAESALGPLVDLNSTGFQIKTTSSFLNTSARTYIYIAIRRGPMKVPTSGTSVFSTVSRSGTSSAFTQNTGGNRPDFAMIKERGSVYGYDWVWYDRLQGPNSLASNNTVQNSIYSQGVNYSAGSVPGYGNNSMSFNAFGPGNASGDNYVYEFFTRAPGFFDEVCYTGTGSATTFSHNLQTTPELMIVKVRNTSNVWAVYHKDLGATKYVYLHSTNAVGTFSGFWNNTSPTLSAFTVGNDSSVCGSGNTYVAYLFATLAGVSKVGSYTGNGSSQTINCGFTGGARFVLIKRTDAAGDWYVWDTARGIVSGNDPHLSLNTTTAEVTTDDTIDTDSTGFVVNQVTATNVNVSSATYIFLAIA
jgi:hypothetical protein